MEITVAIAGLSALAQSSRLAAFRLLVRAGRPGMAAGAIAKALRVPANTLSAHLAILARAGLVTSRRNGRSIAYAIDYDRTRALLAFLMEDCCRAERAVSAPVLARVLPQCCPQPAKGSKHEAPTRQSRG